RAAKGSDPNYMKAMLERIPLHRLCTPEEVAAAVVYLASPQAASITGQVLVLDGGLTAGLVLGFSVGPPAESGIAFFRHSCHGSSPSKWRNKAIAPYDPMVGQDSARRSAKTRAARCAASARA